MEKDVLAQVQREVAGSYQEAPATRKREFTEAARHRLGELAEQHAGLVPMLESAAARGLTVSGTGPGDISLHLGPMAYPLDCGAVTGPQVQQLQALLNGFPDGHVIIGWCPGNINQSKPGLLVGTLREHDRVLAEGAPSDRGRLTVHSAAYQSQWNPDVIARRLAGLKRSHEDGRDAVCTQRVFNETRKRFLDGKRFEAQTNLALPGSANTTPTLERSADSTETDAVATATALSGLDTAASGGTVTSSAFDALIEENGGRIFSGHETGDKARHVAAATVEIRDILDKLRFGQESECIDFRRLLAERQLILRQYARQRLLNKQVADQRTQLHQNQRELVRVAKERFAADGAEKQRRAELALHSMDVLEQTAVGVLKPATFPKRELRSGDAPLAGLFPVIPQERILEPGVAGFCSRLFDAVADDKSTAYVSSQEYEFASAARQTPILYIYASDPGPFITEQARTRVSPLIGQALNLSGEELQPVVSQLSGKPDFG